MESTASAKRTFWPSRWTIQYQAKLTLKRSHSGVILDTILRHILPKEVLSGEEVWNIKGRDEKLVLAPGTPSSALPKGEEFLYVQGSFMKGRSKEEHADFRVRIGSEFLDFPSSKEIRHNVHISTPAAFPSFLPIDKLGVVFPARLERVRFGIDRFTAQRGSLLSGVTPTVTEALQIDIAHDELYLQITAEDLKEKTDNPFEENGIFPLLCSSVQFASGEDLKKDYNEKMGAA